MTDTASTEGEPSDEACELAPTTFKSDVWKLLGFPPVARNEKVEKVTKRQKTLYRNWKWN